MSKAVEVSNLHVSYFGDEVVKDVNFKIDKGRLVGIIGPNGAGKSTMIKAILGLINKDKGRVLVNGKEIKKERKNIAYVPQRNDIDWDFPINVFDTVLLGTYPKLGLLRRPKEKEKNLAMDALKRVEMDEYKDSQIGELSGGQQQRIFLARAIAQQADIYFLDEPFVGIDISSERTIMEILNNLKNEGKTIFVVHHDLSKVEEYFDDLILINKEIIKTGKVENVFKEKIMNQAYNSDFSFMRSNRKVGAI